VCHVLGGQEPCAAAPLPPPVLLQSVLSGAAGTGRAVPHVPPGCQGAHGGVCVTPVAGAGLPCAMQADVDKNSGVVQHERPFRRR
jgi:hypothetical protein